MPSNLQQFKKKAFAKPGGRAAYDALAEEFAFLDEVLEAHAQAKTTQGEAADGTSRNRKRYDLRAGVTLGYGRCRSTNARTPTTMLKTSECVMSSNFPWSALFRQSPHTVICLFSELEITSICFAG